MITPAVLFGEFVGRSQELDVLHARYEQTLRDRVGSVVFVEGEAGIGKTRLLAEFANKVRPLGEVVVGRCERFGAPYRTFADCIAQWRSRAEFANNPAMRKAARAANAVATVALEESQNDGRQRVAAIVRAFEVACDRATGLAFILDDAHWSDYATARAFVELAMLAAQKPLLLICAYRVSDLAADSRLAATFAEIAASKTRVVLGRLTSSEVVRLVCGAAPSIDRFTAKRLCDLAEGNPYVAEELSRSALESETGTANPVNIPGSLRSAILARLGGFSQAERAMLETASIFANEIDVDALAFVCGVPAEKLTGVLDAACRAQLLEPIATLANTRYRFRHALGREVVYRSLIVPQAQSLHKVLADRLESTGGDVAEIAYQRWSANDTVRGAAACEASGDRAMSLAATADAASEYECALGLLRDDLDALERIGGKAIRALYLCGRTDDAANQCTRIAAKLEHSGRFANAAALRLVGVGAAHCAGRANDAAAMLEDVRLRLAERKDAGLDVEILIQRARLAATAANRSELCALLETRDSLALTPLDDVRFAQFEALRDYLQGDFVAMERSSRTAAERADAHDFFEQSIVAFSNLGVALDRQGKARQAVPYLDRCIALARKIGDIRKLELTLNNRIDVALELGDLQTARDLAREPVAEPDPSFAGRRLAAECHLARVLGTDPEPLFEAYDGLERVGQAFLAPTCAANLAWCFPIDDARQRTFFASLCDANADPAGFDAAYLYAAATLGTMDEAAAAAASTLRDGPPRIRAIADLVRARYARRRHADDRALARRAATVFARMGYVLWQAHALDLAGNTQGATALLRDLGFDAEARRLADGFGYAKPAKPAVALSTREREIAWLVARGLSNRKIGDRLGVTHRTVETHVQNAFKKLGVNSRMQLAQVLATSLGVSQDALSDGR